MLGQHLAYREEGDPISSGLIVLCPQSQLCVTFLKGCLSILGSLMKCAPGYINSIVSKMIGSNRFRSRTRAVLGKSEFRKVVCPVVNNFVIY